MAVGPSVTMKDVADKAGVSLSTVSYVLSGARPISEPTRALILKAMDELNFHPNVVARALASKRTRILALLLSPEERTLSLSHMEFVKGATEAARKLDHHLVLLTEGMDSEADLAYLKAQGLIDGVILMEVHLNDPRVGWLQKLGLPFAIIGRPDPTMGIPFVDIDFDETVQTILGHLAGLGHRRVGFINLGQEAYDTGYGPAVRIQEAFQARCRALSLELSLAQCSPNPRAGWDACLSLVDGPRPPTSLVVMNERALPGVLQALASRNLGVPLDMSVVTAVSTAASAEMMVPALTSADAPSGELARLAVANLVRTIETPKAGVESVLIPCQLITRASTGPAPQLSIPRVLKERKVL